MPASNASWERRRAAAAARLAAHLDITTSPTRKPHHTPAAGTAGPPAGYLDNAVEDGPAVPSLGSHHYEWCTTCKAWTLAAGTVTLLTPTGTMPVGRWAVCETCGHTPEADRA